MNNYSQADMAFKKLIDSMKQNGSVFTSADAMVEEFQTANDYGRVQRAGGQGRPELQ